MATRTYTSTTYSGKTRTSQITEVATLAEDLLSLADASYELANVEERIAALEQAGQTSGDEYTALVSGRAKINARLTLSGGLVNGYDGTATS